MHGNVFEKWNPSKRPLILDGAVGSRLQHLCADDTKLWTSELNITKPIEVQNLHEQYVSSDADIITTNTFRSNPCAIKKDQSEITSEKLVEAGINLAKNAATENEIIIAGSNAPAEDCYQVDRTVSKEELILNHHQHINLLSKFGADIIWNETFSHFDEIEIVCNYCSSYKLPFVLNLYFNRGLKILSGEDIIEVIKYVKRFNPLGIGFNCISPELLTLLLSKHTPDYNWGFYLNCGSGNVTDKEINCGISPSDYWEKIKLFIEYKPLFIGACCGSGPEHIKFIKEKVSEIY